MERRTLEGRDGGGENKREAARSQLERIMTDYLPMGGGNWRAIWRGERRREKKGPPFWMALIRHSLVEEVADVMVILLLRE